MLYQADTDMLFPPRVIPRLAKLRGSDWDLLIDHLRTTPQSHPETLGFMLMMVRLNGCMTCHADSYRAMRGCTICAQQSISRFKGADQELLHRWQNAVADIQRWLDENIPPDVD